MSLVHCLRKKPNDLLAHANLTNFYTERTKDCRKTRKSVSQSPRLATRFSAICVMTVADSGAAAIESVSNHISMLAFGLPQVADNDEALACCSSSLGPHSHLWLKCRGSTVEDMLGISLVPRPLYLWCLGELGHPTYAARVARLPDDGACITGSPLHSFSDFYARHSGNM